MIFPVASAVPLTPAPSGPPLRVTLALAPEPFVHVTVTTTVPTGMSTVTLVVLPPVTATLLVEPERLPFVAVTVMPEPAGTFGTVTLPVASVVVPAVIVPLMFPPVRVTVAPETGVSAEVTVTATEPTASRSGR